LILLGLFLGDELARQNEYFVYLLCVTGFFPCRYGIKNGASFNIIIIW